MGNDRFDEDDIETKLKFYKNIWTCFIFEIHYTTLYLIESSWDALLFTNKIVHECKKWAWRCFIYLRSKEKDVYLLHTSDISLRPYFEQKLASVEVVYI